MNFFGRITRRWTEPRMREFAICRTCERIIIRSLEYPTLWANPRRDINAGGWGCTPREGSVVRVDLDRLTEFGR